jgi:hypothetical protein
MVPAHIANVIGHGELVVTAKGPRRMARSTIIRGDNPEARL